jgi:hypothetical protein
LDKDVSLSSGTVNKFCTDLEVVFEVIGGVVDSLDDEVSNASSPRIGEIGRPGDGKDSLDAQPFQKLDVFSSIYIPDVELMQILHRRHYLADVAVI